MSARLNPQIVSSALRLSHVVAVFSAAVGTAVLIGWIFDVTVLKSVLPGLVTMKVNTAICFILSGIALKMSLNGSEKSRRRTITIILASAVTLIGFASLSEYVFKIDLGIDQLLIHDLHKAQQHSFPGRMSPATALMFILIGFSLLFLDLETANGKRPAQYSTAAVGMLALLALIGYAYGVSSLYSIFAYSSVALHTAAVFLVLSAGVFLARPDRGWMIVIASDAAGGIAARRLLFPVVLILFLFGWIGLQGQLAGFYDARFGPALFALSNIMVLGILIWRSSLLLNAIDGKRRQAEIDLQKANETLAARVEERTAELAAANENLLIEVAERKSTEEKVRKSESLLSKVLETLPVGVWITDEKGNIVSGNHAGREIWIGEKYVGVEQYGEYKGWWADTGKKIEAEEWALARAVNKGEISIGEVVDIECFDGTRKTILNSSVPIFDDHKKIIGAIVVNQDITKRKRDEDALRESETRFRNAFDYAAIGMALVSLEGRFMKVNCSLCEIVGYSQEELAEKTFQEITHPEDLEKDLDLADKLLAGEIAYYHMEKRYIHKLGHVIWVILSGTLVRDRQGNPLYFIAQIQDVTKRKKAEEEIFASQRRFAGILDIAEDAIISVDEGNIIRLFNKGAEKIFGYEAHEAIGRPLDLLLPKRFLESHRSHIAGFSSSPNVARSMGERREIFGLRKSGEEFPAEASISKLVLREEKILTVILRDITDRKRAEQELRNFADKLEQSNRDLQDFAFVASHDLQEPLTKIQAFGDCLMEDCSESLNAEGREYVERMQNAAVRMRKLITDLLTYSRITTKAQPFVNIDLNRTVQDVLSDLEVRILDTEGKIEIGDLPSIEADPTQMRQLFQNLIGNALKFHREGVPPIVRIASKIATGDAALSEHLNGQVCKITIEDNGIGFDEKYSERIFTLFQRLHGRNKYDGTGIGLAICRKIVERHHGLITANSKPNEGSVFSIFLPVSQNLESGRVRLMQIGNEP